MEAFLTPELVQGGGAAGVAIAGLIFLVRYLANVFKSSLESIGARFENREIQQAEVYKATLKLLADHNQAIASDFKNSFGSVDARHDNIEKELVAIRGSINIIMTEVLYNRAQNNVGTTPAQKYTITNINKEGGDVNDSAR